MTLSTNWPPACTKWPTSHSSLVYSNLSGLEGLGLGLGKTTFYYYV